MVRIGYLRESATLRCSGKQFGGHHFSAIPSAPVLLRHKMAATSAIPSQYDPKQLGLFTRPLSGVHSAIANCDACDTSRSPLCHALAMYASASVSSSGRPKDWDYYSWGARGAVGAAVWADSFVSMTGEVTRWKVEGRYSEACRWSTVE